MNLQAIGVKPLIMLFVLLALGPVVAAAALRWQAGSLGHPILWVIVGVSAVTLLVIAFSMKKRTVDIQDGQVLVHSTFYTRSFPLAEITRVTLLVQGAADDPVGMRMNGLGLPGFQSGWFRSKLGGKIFVDRSGGDYLLVFVNGVATAALGFSDNEAALRQLKAELPSKGGAK